MQSRKESGIELHLKAVKNIHLGRESMMDEASVKIVRVEETFLIRRRASLHFLPVRKISLLIIGQTFGRPPYQI